PYPPGGGVTVRWRSADMEPVSPPGGALAEPRRHGHGPPVLGKTCGGPGTVACSGLNATERPLSVLALQDSLHDVPGDGAGELAAGDVVAVVGAVLHDDGDGHGRALVGDGVGDEPGVRDGLVADAVLGGARLAAHPDAVDPRLRAGAVVVLDHGLHGL